MAADYITGTMLEIDENLCLQCGGCVALCPEEALLLSFERLHCVQSVCTMCHICINFCPVEALKEKAVA